MHVYVDIEICGSKSCKKLKDVLVDTGASFTTITQEDADEIGIPITVPRKFMTAKDTTTYPVGAAIVKIEGKEGVNLITISKEGMRAIGTLSLESFRFKVDPVKGKLEYQGLPLA